MWMFNRKCKVSEARRQEVRCCLKPATCNLKPDRGFGLIESLIATAIVGIGFVGVYSMVVLSEQFIKWAIARQKLQMTANQMLEVIEGDVANIANYTMTTALTTCTDPSPATDTYLVRGFEWCTRMSDEVGAAGITDTRSITVTATSATKNTVLIVLEAYGAQAQIVMERSYGN